MSLNQEQVRKNLIEQYELSSDATKGLIKWVDMLRSWSQYHSLISKSQFSCIWSYHIKNSLELANYILAKNPNCLVLDIGSGAGFPAIPIAALLKSINSQGKVICLESSRKKTIFLNQVAAATNFPIKAVNQRVETFNPSLLKIDTITCRAVSQINNLLLLTEKLIKNDVNAIWLKGENVDQEISQAYLHGWNDRFNIEKIILEPQINQTATQRNSPHGITVKNTAASAVNITRKK